MTFAVGFCEQRCWCCFGHCQLVAQRVYFGTLQGIWMVESEGFISVPELRLLNVFMVVLLLAELGVILNG